MICVIVGPTGIGKTKLSISLAHHYKAEIINADSVQIYKETNIGSAKIKEEEKENIPHHLLSTKSLNEDNTVYSYQKEGRKILNELLNKNKNVIIVGGSGLYIKALLYDYKLSAENKIIHDFDEYSNSELKNKVDSIYKDNNIHENNRKRLIRFLNHYESTGNIIKTKKEINKPIYDFITIALTTDRKKLNEIVDKRVDIMLKEGLIEEAKSLYDKKYKKLDSIIGYKELNKYFRNEITKKEAIEEIKSDTRKYVKRQYTWFKNQMKDIIWVNTDFDNFNNTVKEVIEIIDKY